LAALEDALTDDLTSITVTDTVTWPPNGAVFGDLAVAPAPANHTKEEAPAPVFTATRILADLTAPTIAKWGSGNDGPAFRIKTGVYAKILPTSPLGVANTCTNDCPDDAFKGFKYRPASPGYLLVCKQGDCNKGDDNAVAVSEGLISQLGRVFVIPLKSGLFSKKSLSATFDQNGQVTLIGLKNTASSGEEGAKTLGSVVDVIGAARAKIKPNELETLNAKTALLKAQKDYLAAQAAMQPAANAEKTKATEAFSADTALIEARLANIAAQDELNKALEP